MARAALGFDAADVVIGAVGRLEPQKRFDLLLDALQRSSTRATQPGAGDRRRRQPPERPAAARRSAAARFGVPASWATATMSPMLHHAFDLFVQSSDYEGTPNAVLEAMALETPIVATDAGGTAELVHDGVEGLIVPPGDPDALVRAIAQALTDTAGTMTRTRAARRRVETDLSFDARTKTVEAVYRSCAVAVESPRVVLRPCRANDEGNAQSRGAPAGYAGRPAAASLVRGSFGDFWQGSGARGIDAGARAGAWTRGTVPCGARFWHARSRAAAHRRRPSSSARCFRRPEPELPSASTSAQVAIWALSTWSGTSSLALESISPAVPTRTAPTHRRRFATSPAGASGCASAREAGSAATPSFLPTSAATRLSQRARSSHARSPTV